MRIEHDYPGRQPQTERRKPSSKPKISFADRAEKQKQLDWTIYDRAFGAIDRDGTGFVRASEILKVIEKQVNARRFWQLFEKADTEKAGVIDRGTFLNLMLNLTNYEQNKTDASRLKVKKDKKKKKNSSKGRDDAGHFESEMAAENAGVEEGGNDGRIVVLGLHTERARYTVQKPSSDDTEAAGDDARAPRFQASGDSGGRVAQQEAVESTLVEDAIGHRHMPVPPPLRPSEETTVVALPPIGNARSGGGSGGGGGGGGSGDGGVGELENMSQKHAMIQEQQGSGQGRHHHSHHYHHHHRRNVPSGSQWMSEMSEQFRALSQVYKKQQGWANKAARAKLIANTEVDSALLKEARYMAMPADRRVRSMVRRSALS